MGDHVESRRHSLVVSTAPQPRDWITVLTLDGATAQTTVYNDVDIPASLANYFGRLAESWRGWEDRRDWFSLEGQLDLSATHDGLGTVRLGVVLSSSRNDADPSSWSLAGMLMLDAGQLDALARHLRSR